MAASKRPIQNLQTDKYPNTGKHISPMEQLPLGISESFSLIHDPSVCSGKTRDMAKGLFLCCRGRLCAGESAGMGLPIWKTRSRTYFPSLVNLYTIGRHAIEKEFTMNLILAWHIAGKRAPEWVSGFMECIVNWYMKIPAFQHRLLKLRDRVFSLFALNSFLVPGDEMGHCRVMYEATPQGFIIKVDNGSLQGQGRLIMLNEVDGQAFDRLRVGDLVLQGDEIPAWKKVSFSARLESPLLDAGLSLLPGMNTEYSSYALFCGREVARGLDWAGIAVMNQQSRYTYRVIVHPLAGA